MDIDSEKENVDFEYDDNSMSFRDANLTNTFEEFIAGHDVVNISSYSGSRSVKLTLRDCLRHVTAQVKPRIEKRQSVFMFGRERLTVFLTKPERDDLEVQISYWRHDKINDVFVQYMSEKIHSKLFGIDGKFSKVVVNNSCIPLYVSLSASKIDPWSKE